MRWNAYVGVFVTRRARLSVYGRLKWKCVESSLSAS